MRGKKYLRKFTALFLLILSLISGLILYADFTITNSAGGRIFSAADSISHNRVGLLLGTTKFVDDGTVNPYYRNRAKAACELYEADKIDFILVSGDNSRVEYDESTEMKKKTLFRSEWILQKSIWIMPASARSAPWSN